MFAGERRDRVGELLVDSEFAGQQQQQREMLEATTEAWNFAAANLEPQQLEALQQAACNPVADLQQNNSLVQQAVKRLREAELNQLMQQLPEAQRAAVSVDPKLQQQLLLEQGYLLHLVQSAFSS